MWARLKLKYQLGEYITINIPTSNKFSPFQTMQVYSSTNTTFSLENKYLKNKLALNSVPFKVRGKYQLQIKILTKPNPQSQGIRK